jgi:flagellar basal body P-ring protein FlgI
MNTRRDFLLLSLSACLGCTGPVIRPQSPESEHTPETDVVLVGALSRPYGTNFIKLECISLVTGLAGTGEDPAPSVQRAAVIDEMHRRNIIHADQILASPDTALVLVRGFLKPGIQKGDKFDVEVRVPSRSETTSLRGGYLLESRMTELAVLAGAAHKGHTMGLAQGPVLVDPSADSSNKANKLIQGWVLGGGTAIKERSLGLVVHEEQRTIRVSQQIGSSINHRFHTHVKGVKQGVATPKTDEFIELLVHPRYKDNITRYVQVIRSIPFRETPSALQARLQLLERQLHDPVTCSSAALRLEAIGPEAIPTLLTGIKAEDPEVRFRAAEALAYLDQTDAAKPLGNAAANEPAFRAGAMQALSAMDDAMARDELHNLLHVSSAETRYGAFRALWEMNPNDPIISGRMLGGQFSYHVVESDGPAMIHVTRSTRPEIVMFGVGQRFTLPLALEAGKHIILTGEAGDSITVSRFAVGEPDQKRQVSTLVEDVIHAILDLGGTYPDVVQVLQQAKEKNALTSRFKVDALPRSGREFDRDDLDGESDDSATAATNGWGNLLPWKKSGG